MYVYSLSLSLALSAYMFSQTTRQEMPRAKKKNVSVCLAAWPGKIIGEIFHQKSVVSQSVSQLNEMLC